MEESKNKREVLSTMKAFDMSINRNSLRRSLNGYKTLRQEEQNKMDKIINKLYLYNWYNIVMYGEGYFMYDLKKADNIRSMNIRNLNTMYFTLRMSRILIMHDDLIYSKDSSTNGEIKYFDESLYKERYQNILIEHLVHLQKLPLHYRFLYDYKTLCEECLYPSMKKSVTIFNEDNLKELFELSQVWMISDVVYMQRSEDVNRYQVLPLFPNKHNYDALDHRRGRRK